MKKINEMSKLPFFLVEGSKGFVINFFPVGCQKKKKRIKKCILIRFLYVALKKGLRPFFFVSKATFQEHLLVSRRFTIPYERSVTKFGQGLPFAKV
jgi:hypothetical protein